MSLVGGGVILLCVCVCVCVCMCVCSRVERQVKSYVEEDSPEAYLSVGADMRKIKLCFQLMKVRKNMHNMLLQVCSSCIILYAILLYY